MKTIAPPRLAVALLRRHLAHNEPLVGDLLEEFETRQSRVWFWWQVVMALLTTAGRPEELRPLHLVEVRSTPLQPRPSAAMPRRIGVNGGMVLTASPIRGIGGIGVAALLLLMTALRPATWSFALLALGTGLLLGVARILYTRRRSALDERARTHVLIGR